METGSTQGHRFTPYKIWQLKDLVQSLSNIGVQSLKDKKVNSIHGPIIYFFMRYLAGGNNIKGEFADIDLAKFMNHMTGDDCREPLVKAVAKQTRLMVKGKNFLSGELTTEKLVQLNQLLVSNRNKGMRKERVWVGKKQKNPLAFQACHYSKVRMLLEDLIAFLNDDSIDIISRLALGTHQFAMIHPFMDGNGRSWRCFFWQKLSENCDEVQVLLIIAYFKLLDREGLYECCKQLRNGLVDPYVNYWAKCLDWSNKAYHVFHEIITDPESLSGLDVSQIIEFDYFLKNEKRNMS